MCLYREKHFLTVAATSIRITMNYNYLLIMIKKPSWTKLSNADLTVNMNYAINIFII